VEHDERRDPPGVVDLGQRQVRRAVSVTLDRHARADGADELSLTPGVRGDGFALRRGDPAFDVSRYGKQTAPILDPRVRREEGAHGDPVARLERRLEALSRRGRRVRTRQRGEWIEAVADRVSRTVTPSARRARASAVGVGQVEHLQARDPDRRPSR
jgi:hypothetical protein